MGTEASARLVSFTITSICLFSTLSQLGSEFKCQSIAQKLPDEEAEALQLVNYLKSNNQMSYIHCNKSSNDPIKCDCSFQNRTICHVTEIFHILSDSALMGSGLTGVIPKELGNLRHLRELDLSNNQLIGSIPASLGKLSSLYKLDLSNNQLTDSIPASLGNLSSLSMLNLYKNQLTGSIPASLGNMKLQVLMDHTSSRNMAVTFELDLSYNQLSGSIPVVSAVASDPDANRLLKLKQYDRAAVYSDFYLDLSHNQLTGPIPESLGNLTFISYIDLANNCLNGSIPASLGTLTYLRQLRLRNNGISGTLPQTLGNLTVLEFFGVASNSITGTVPKSFASLPNLYGFSISGNYLSGPFPDFIANWTSIVYLSISDVEADSHFQFPPSINVAKSFCILILRNCSITGQIPSYIGSMSSLTNIDLSFNNLTERIPDSLKHLNLSYMSFSNNMLSGKIPDWIQNASKWIKMDFSYNNFSKLTFKPSPNLNLFSCCCNSSTCLPNTEYPTKEKYCPRGKHDYHSLFINCGGEETHDAVGNVYDQDNDTSVFYLSPKRNWARSSVGNCYDSISNGNSSKLLKSIRCGLSSEAHLYDNARTSPVSLKYYGFCLHKGKYNVTLHFAEIVDEVTDIHEVIDFRSTSKRVFDVYIQGERKLKDFNIIDKAGRTNEEYMINFTAVDVNDGTLEIHFYSRSAGVGTLDGPLISAISVTTEYKQRLSSLQIALITVASIIVFLLLLLLFAWMMGWLGNTDHLQEIDIGIENPVTLKQLKDATRNFSKRNEIGQGGFGTVYKAEVQGKIVAVKKLWSHSEERINEFINEFYTLKSMSQENLVQLLDIYNAKGLHLLIYEYMENNSLAHALFDSKSRLNLDWKVRFNICLGIARGLMYLHEHPRMKIVHSDIKSANILLDGNLKAKISDFGLARLHTKDDEFKFIKVEVPQGYMAPEYVRGIVTSKADVYSFGVVILETVSGRTNAGHRGDSQESEFLLDTAYDLHRKGRLVDLVDKTLSTKYDAKQAIIILNLAVKCTSISPTLRPTMSEVVSVLVGDKKIEEICSPALNDSHLARVDFSVSMEATSRASTSSYLIKGEDETKHISESTPLRLPNETW
ncbi:probable LRR receptor-like serine/threonine-protein kinase At1g53430 isoform X3 [Rosa chinensis]|uniref:probable LRR receptor-like serine/threonine-protein kinase At1g53430 isoform X3 n=1 Tax=Rosa chinensis TaxID=74649 RepID=UPI001AD93617|nr:probable LRR receptor-like serine/threonine-protein kinase At1g53430 isoform X3 [Rosa chinensis]